MFVESTVLCTNIIHHIVYMNVLCLMLYPYHILLGSTIQVLCVCLVSGASLYARISYEHASHAWYVYWSLDGWHCWLPIYICFGLHYRLVGHHQPFYYRVQVQQNNRVSQSAEVGRSATMGKQYLYKTCRWSTISYGGWWHGRTYSLGHQHLLLGQEQMMQGHKHWLGVSCLLP